MSERKSFFYELLTIMMKTIHVNQKLFVQCTHGCTHTTFQDKIMGNGVLVFCFQDKVNWKDFYRKRGTLKCLLNTFDICSVFARVSVRFCHLTKLFCLKQLPSVHGPRVS